MKKIYFDFKHLLIHGIINQHIDSPNFHLVSILTILLSFITSIIFVFISHQFTEYFSLSIYKSYMYQKETIFTLFHAVIIAPSLEEISTRYPLKKEKFGLILFFTIIFYYISPLIIDLNQCYRILSSILIFSFFLLVLNKNKIYISFVNKFYQHPKIVLYAFSLVFGIMHIFNFNITMNLLFFSIILIFPYFISGLMFSYVRLRFSLIHCILLHALNNFLITFPAFLLNHK